MPRKLITPANSEKPNPLQRMLGTFLRLERRRLKLESKVAAEALGLSDTYFRLVEAGRATLNQSLIFRLVELFAAQSTGAAVTPRQIEFQRLALLLVGTHWVSAEMKDLGGRNADRRAMEALADRDADFALLHTHTIAFYALPEGSTKQRDYLESVAAPEIGDFLSSAQYSRPTKQTLADKVLPTSSILSLPTLNVEMITRLVADLTDRPFVHTPRLASIWETRTAPLVRGVSGLYKRADLIVNSENLSLFTYPYLLERTCQQLRYLFCDEGQGDELKGRFVKQLNVARKKNNLDPLTREHSDKVTFKCLSEAEGETFRSQLEMLSRQRGSSGDADTYEAYWSFETTMGVPISFVGRQGSNAEAIWNLSLEESLEKKLLFEEIWSGVDASAR